MASKDIIQLKIDRLIDIMLTDGVQPGDLADNIFLENYQQITYKKSKDFIVGEVIIDESELNSSSYTLRYYYSANRRIERIEEENQGNISIQWDRTLIMSELINDIVDMLLEHYSKSQMNKFLKSLPPELRDKVVSRLNEVA